ncbi:MAG: stage II sporulation protein M [Treponema sp.]|nr:stage II sporulation protein M [Treponema sp.]
MTEQIFTMRRESSWREFNEMIIAGRKKIKYRAPVFIRLFREITQDMNTARANGFDPAIIERLNLMVNEGYQIIYGQSDWPGQFDWPGRLNQPLEKISVFITRTFPRSVRSRWRGILGAALLFYGVTGFFGVLCVHFPRMAGEIVSEYQLESIEEMYNPNSGHFLTPRDTASDADMFGFYIYNNISIAFRTFAGGILAGIGSLFFLCSNAVFFGVTCAHIINIGYEKTFFPFIIAHSAFELNAVIFSAYAGLSLGFNFFIPRGMSRSASIRKAGHDALPIIAGSALMLVIAAVIEAFWSSRYLLPLPLRMGAGIGMWGLVLAYFLFAGRKDERAI